MIFNTKNEIVIGYGYSFSKELKIVCDCIIEVMSGKRILLVTHRKSKMRKLFNIFDLSEINIEDCKDGLRITKK